MSTLKEDLEKEQARVKELAENHGAGYLDMMRAISETDTALETENVVEMVSAFLALKHYR